jgi:hypothetical protein
MWQRAAGCLAFALLALWMTLDPLLPQDFWYQGDSPYTANIGTWRAPGDRPTGFGSIKMIRTVSTGSVPPKRRFKTF